MTCSILDVLGEKKAKYWVVRTGSSDRLNKLIFWSGLAIPLLLL